MKVLNFTGKTFKLLMVLGFVCLSGTLVEAACGSSLFNRINTDAQLTNKAKTNFRGVFRTALRFHRSKKVSNSLRDDYLSVIDFSLPSTARRYFLVDLKRCTYTSDFVGHGSGTGRYANGKKWLTHCASGTARASRRNLTRKGFFKYSAYHSSGKNWRRIYRNYKGIQLQNLNGNTQDNDVNGGNVVIHEASYVLNRPVEQGRSHGCYAFARGQLKEIAPKLIGGLVYAHAPQCG